ncbi:MAG: class I SAM-dependent methyltransferase, partial [Chthoniobacterales bacterium]
PGYKLLDFGCADARLMRNFYELALRPPGEVWGVDIDARRITWNQQNLSPPFKFLTTTSFPHLPFEDGYFDFVYAGSVFTHIADLAEAWLLELRRVTQPGAWLYITVHDHHSIEVIERTKNPLIGAVRDFEKTTSLSLPDIENLAMFASNRTPGQGAEGEAQVFYDIDYLQSHWGNYLKVVSINPEAYGYQTAVLLQK